MTITLTAYIACSHLLNWNLSVIASLVIVLLNKSQQQTSMIVAAFATSPHHPLSWTAGPKRRPRLSNTPLPLYLQNTFKHPSFRLLSQNFLKIITANWERRNGRRRNTTPLNLRYEGLDQEERKDSITLYIVVGISKLLGFATYCTLGLRA